MTKAGNCAPKSSAVPGACANSLEGMFDGDVFGDCGRNQNPTHNAANAIPVPNVIQPKAGTPRLCVLSPESYCFEVGTSRRDVLSFTARMIELCKSEPTGGGAGGRRNARSISSCGRNKLENGNFITNLL